MNSKLPIAFFDFDGTLTTRDSLLYFLRHLAGTPKFIIQILNNSPSLLAFVLGFLPNHVAKERLLVQCLNGITYERLQVFVEEFIATSLPKIMRHQGFNHFLYHKALGHECVLVSASLDCYLQPWSRMQGFSGCISTQLEIKNGIYTGKLHGFNCYGKQKAQRIKALYPDIENRTSYAYGDSKGDIEMLELCNYGFLWSSNEFKLLKKQTLVNS